MFGDFSMMPRDNPLPPSKLRLNGNAERKRPSLSVAASIIISSLLLSFGTMMAAYILSSGEKSMRYQLLNVGNGETQRLDRETGTITKCADGECYDLTEGPKPIGVLSDDEIIWDDEI